MTAVLLALLVAATAPTAESPRITTYYDDTVIVGAGRFRTLDLSLPEEPARIVCSFEVVQGGSGIRAVLLKSEDAERWLRGEAHDVEAATPFGRRGAFSHKPADPDHYVIVLDNRMEGRASTEVRLTVRTVQGDGHVGPVTPADPVRGQILVWSTMALFFGICIYSGRQIHLRARALSKES
ncbi:MAG: hypothetical protein HY821_15600 [Acidobacteria bacterium]|nr:hypothetical protein [Acidobacteriota bacterium]